MPIAFGLFPLPVTNGREFIHSPAWLVLAVVGGVFVAALLTRGAASLGRASRRLPYSRRPSLLTANELGFYHALARAVAGRYAVFAQVRLADVIQVSDGVMASEYRARFNRIACKHADFVLCDPQTLAVVGVIELDDRSHQRADRQERDAFFDAALQSAGVRLLRVPARSLRRSYQPSAIEELIHRAFEATPN